MMAISPSSNINYQNVDFVEARIDEVYQRDSSSGNPEDLKEVQGAIVSEFSATAPRELNAAEKAELTRRYMKAGWDYVIVLNSSENGERGGMVMVKLVKKVARNATSDDIRLNNAS